MTKRALLIEWDPSTGERAGNINPKDPKLRCNGWQNMDVSPAIELRLVEDDRDLLVYENADGITILNGRDEINEAIDINFTSKIVIEDELIYSEHIKSLRGQLDISKLPDNREERLKDLKSKYGIKGIKEIEPMKV